jgi:hypothetical protein
MHQGIRPHSTNVRARVFYFQHSNLVRKKLYLCEGVKKWPETDLNRRHVNFQSTALPTELSGLNFLNPCGRGGSKSARHSFDNLKIVYFVIFQQCRRFIVKAPAPDAKKRRNTSNLQHFCKPPTAQQKTADLFGIRRF